MARPLRRPDGEGDAISTGFDFCKVLLPKWRNGLSVDHNNLRESLMRRDKIPISYSCPRCGIEVMNRSKDVVI